MKLPWSHSIAQRLKWGYYVLVALMAIGFIIKGINLSRVESQIYALETTSKLLDNVLEIRRYEKNWLLYNKPSDFTTNQEMIAKTFELLLTGNNDFFKLKSIEVGSSVTVERLQNVLTNYSNLMKKEEALVKSGQKHRFLHKIRKEGKLLVNLAEIMNNSVLFSSAETLKFVKFSGLVSLVFAILTAIILGKQLSFSVVRPLRQIVHCTNKIASGEMQSCEQHSETPDLDEIVAVKHAIEVMLKKLEHREKLVIQSEKLAAVGTLVAGVAHELNNPLSNAGTSAQILLEEMRESEDVPRRFQLEMLEQITEQTDRARSIVRSLLEFSREKAVNPEQLKISDLLHQTLDLVRGEIPTHVETRVIVDNDGIFWADKQRLQQALVNLLLNAFQAVGDDAKIVLRGNLNISENKVCLEVEDDGPGIPAEIRKNVFDPFYTTKDVGQGAGLGLAISREIIDKHGGVITVESAEGVGTKFIIKIPVEKS